MTTVFVQAGNNRGLSWGLSREADAGGSSAHAPLALIIFIHVDPMAANCQFVVQGSPQDFLWLWNWLSHLSRTNQQLSLVTDKNWRM